MECALAFASLCSGKLKTKYFTSAFYALNICGLAFGLYLVVAYSIYRILVLYCLFSVIFFWITERSTSGMDEFSLKGLAESKWMMNCLAISVIMLMSFLAISSYGSLYSRPSFLPSVIAVILVLAAILALASIDRQRRSFFTSTRFLLPALIAITLLINFSICRLSRE
jgi:hypothetical protein